MAKHIYLDRKELKAILKRQCLRGRIRTIEAVEQTVSAWQDRLNEAKVTID